jgi:hypothetical protein
MCACVTFCAWLNSELYLKSAPTCNITVEVILLTLLFGFGITSKCVLRKSSHVCVLFLIVPSGEGQKSQIFALVPQIFSFRA